MIQKLDTNILEIIKLPLYNLNLFQITSDFIRKRYGFLVTNPLSQFSSFPYQLVGLAGFFKFTPPLFSNSKQIRVPEVMAGWG